MVKVDNGALFEFSTPDQLPFTLSPMPLAEVPLSPHPYRVKASALAARDNLNRGLIFIRSKVGLTVL